MNDEIEKLRNMLAILLHISDAMVAVCEHEGMEVDEMTVVMEHQETGEQKEVVTSPRKVIAWVKAELGISASKIEITSSEAE